MCGEDCSLSAGLHFICTNFYRHASMSPLLLHVVVSTSTSLPTPGVSGVQLTQLSPQQTPCPGEEVVYGCTVPGNRLRWRISVETGDRILESTSAEVDQNGFRSTAGVFDTANNCFNSTLTFSAQNGTSFICLNRDQSMNESVTVTVQGMWYICVN